MTQRTSQQNKALHVACDLLAQELNDAGLDQRVVLKPSIAIPWSRSSVKENLFRPIMRASLGKESTTELEKIGEIEKVWDILFRHLGEKFGVEYIPFPHDPAKQKSDLLEGMKVDVRNDLSYPTEEPQETDWDAGRKETQVV